MPLLPAEILHLGSSSRLIRHLLRALKPFEADIFVPHQTTISSLTRTGVFVSPELRHDPCVRRATRLTFDCGFSGIEKPSRKAPSLIDRVGETCNGERTSISPVSGTQTHARAGGALSVVRLGPWPSH